MQMPAVYVDWLKGVDGFTTQYWLGACVEFTWHWNIHDLGVFEPSEKLQSAILLTIFLQTCTHYASINTEIWLQVGFINLKTFCTSQTQRHWLFFKAQPLFLTLCSKISRWAFRENSILLSIVYNNMLLAGPPTGSTMAVPCVMSMW